MSVYFSFTEMKILEGLATTGEPQYVVRGNMRECEAAFKLAAKGVVNVYGLKGIPRPRYRIQFPWQDIDLYDWKKLN